MGPTTGAPVAAETETVTGAPLLHMANVHVASASSWRQCGARRCGIRDSPGRNRRVAGAQRGRKVDTRERCHRGAPSAARHDGGGGAARAAARQPARHGAGGHQGDPPGTRALGHPFGRGQHHARPTGRRAVPGSLLGRPAPRRPRRLDRDPRIPAARQLFPAQDRVATREALAANSRSASCRQAVRSTIRLLQNPQPNVNWRRSAGVSRRYAPRPPGRSVFSLSAIRRRSRSVDLADVAFEIRPRATGPRHHADLHGAGGHQGALGHAARRSAERPRRRFWDRRDQPLGQHVDLARALSAHLHRLAHRRSRSRPPALLRRLASEALGTTPAPWHRLRLAPPARHPRGLHATRRPARRSRRARSASRGLRHCRAFGCARARGAGDRACSCRRRA